MTEVGGDNGRTSREGIGLVQRRQGYSPCSERQAGRELATSAASRLMNLVSLEEDVAYNLCLERFDEFVGTPYFDSVLDIETFYPTRDSWENIDDRRVSCLLYDIEDLYMEGSMRDSGR